MKKFLMVLISAFLLGLSPIPAQAQRGWYMDAGLEFVEVGKDLAAVDLGLGLALEFGFEFLPGAVLNVGIGSSTHSEDGWDLTYSRFWIGPRFTLDAGVIKPYFEAGLMSHLLDYDYTFYEIDGTGLYFGGGVFWPLYGGSGFGFYVKYTAWGGEGNSGYIADQGDVSTTIFGGNYVFRF
jgi:hypothetical protein